MHFDTVWRDLCGKLGGPFLYSEGPDQPRPGEEAVKRPAAVVTGRVRDAKDSCGVVGGERKIEAIQGRGKALPKRLYEGFLACPAIEKASQPVARVQVEVRLV